MRVLVFETNLMWSSKLANSLKALGHDPVLLRTVPTGELKGDAAIVNLSEGPLGATTLIDLLRANSIPVIAHAGHKEKALHEIGRKHGADVLATNSEMTFKLEELLARLCP
jgi:non-ribosomal peptide synthetase component E (peptide arylation enzyme)